MFAAPRPKGPAFPLDGVNLDRTSIEPLQRQLHRILSGMIRDRALPPGSELPSTRALAAELRVARNTIVATYDQLATEGYLTSRAGARAVVVDLPAGQPVPDSSQPAPTKRPWSARGEILLNQPVHHGTPGCFAFHPGMPDSKAFPFGVWGRLLARRASFGGAKLFGTYYVTGLPELKEAIAGYLRAARGVRCTPESIVITTGAQAAFDLLARLLIDPGDRVWMEEPGYYGAQAAFVVSGATIVRMPVDADGWRLETPADLPRLIYVTPACQHPLGVTMRMEQRLRLLEIAEQADAWIIEDDFDGEYRFQGRPMPAVQGMDRSDRVIYVGTFAKLLFPALRLGFMVLPSSLQERIPNALSTTGQFAPLLLQAALADFIAGGHMSRHLKRMRRMYATRREFFHEICRDRLHPRMTLSSADAGIQVVGLLDYGLSDLEVARAAAEAGVNVSPLSKYFSIRSARQGLVLGYAACDRAQTEQGIRVLERVFNNCSARPAKLI